ncbi:pentapeptide repeat-containing protein [Modestobacter sp. VKM Ac-2986]|uniref:pentapeptide repeat-containing protein n=1 Tax=Modestobacter sp. VKM Ac-2986 TaxID=3004140 RepID=UPI0022AB44FE|nr:pentapeptide repeat-containing protein [Modestobacter sp. VKM Ac-2986]MCZ2829196.1 pentapeptide repeat-containing protein [Modestobacter sp. VKM Ac-2986]
MTAPRPADPADLATLRADLAADCSRCVGLCCVAPAFAASADFALDKPAGRPCPNLQADSRCGVHARLRDIGFPGCTVFDCLGAGQRVTQHTMGGRDWREGPEVAATMFAVFPVMRQLTELLWHLTEAGTLLTDGPLATAVEAARVRTEAHTLAPAPDLLALDAGGWRREVGELLGQVSDAVRAEVPGRARDRRGADLMGAALRGADLHGASLRGAYLIGADLRGADLRRTDLLGADLRAADLRGADLTGALFVVQPQLTAAIGDAGTRLPTGLARPGHWSTGTTDVDRSRTRRPPRRR